MPFLDMLVANKVRFVVIGGQAMRHLGMPRFTMDWDLYIPYKDNENFARLNQVLEQLEEIPVVPLGAKGENFVQTYQTQWGVVQFHLRPPGLADFAETEKVAITDYNGIKYACLKDMLASKKAVSRPSDALDIEFLQAKLKC